MQLACHATHRSDAANPVAQDRGTNAEAAGKEFQRGRISCSLVSATVGSGARLDRPGLLEPNPCHDA